MAPIPTGHVLFKFTFVLSGDTEEMICSIGSETTAASTADRITACDAAFDAWQANLLPLMANDYNLLRVDGIFGDATGDIPVSSIQGPVAGSDTDAPVPQNTAVLIKKISGIGGRRNRGRMYVPGISVLDIGNTGIINSGPLAAWNTAANNFLLGMESASFLDNLVLFHSNAPLTPTVIADLDVDPIVATQRRRLRP